MRVVGSELLKGMSGSVKFLLNDSGIAFFSAATQHRDFKLNGLSYEDDYLGNAVAGIATRERVEIRFHKAFSDERIRNLWGRVSKMSVIAGTRLGQLYYQGRAIV